MTRSHPPFRQMRQFKAVAADWEYFLSLSDEGSLYCLTDRQVYILLVQCEYIGWLTRWYNTEDTSQATVQLVQSEVMNALMSCVDVSVLISQAELNLVDSVTNKQLESQALRDILEEDYDGSPTSINPNAPTTNFGASGDRNTALCAGLTAFVYQFARNQADSVRAGQVGGLLSVALIAALLIPGLNFFFVVGASIAVILGLGTIGVTTSVAIAALTDTTALDAVICYMRDTLDSQAVSEANWNACLDSYPFTVGSNAAIVADFIKATLPQNYLTILNILGQAYTGVIDGDPLPECPCAPPDPDCNDLTASASGWVATNASGTPSSIFGSYVPGQGLAPASPGTAYFYHSRAPIGGSPTVLSLTWTFNTAITNFGVQRLGGAFAWYTGPAVTSITINSTTHPSFFPLTLGSGSSIGITFTTNIAPSSAFRVIDFCWEPV
jgi:hypothetical protein